LRTPWKIEKGGAELILLIQNHAKGNYVPASILRAAGYQVIEAADGVEGAALLTKHRFDLAIADVLLPNLGGIAIAARIRVAWPDLPIILAGDLGPTGAETILKQPIRTLRTPIDVMELLATIKDMLTRRNPIKARTVFAPELITTLHWENHAGE